MTVFVTAEVDAMVQIVVRVMVRRRSHHGPGRRCCVPDLDEALASAELICAHPVADSL